MLKEGMKAPEFSLADADGKVWTNADFAGKKYVLYFYPKDDTPGCTKEACGIRDDYSKFQALGVPVLGVSADSQASHSKFRAKYGLPFTLLSDPEKKTMNDFGAYGEKMMYGKKVMGVIRSTFIVDGSGVIVKVFPKVTPDGHSAQILAALEG